MSAGDRKMSVIYAAREKFFRSTTDGSKPPDVRLYEKAYGLARRPFSGTADPSFLYESACHREALAALVVGVSQNRGLMSLTGRAGTGKSMLLQALLGESVTSTRSVILCHTTLDRDELVTMILHKLKLEDATLQAPGMHILEDKDFFNPEENTGTPLTRVARLCRLSDFVENEAKARRPPPLLVIDEAQHLSGEALQEIRLLNNLELPDRKLMQLVLAGQPQLDLRLRTPGLGQLHERISIQARLRPLNLEETVGYVAHRLKVAECSHPDLFTSDSLGSLWEASEGIPRLLNSLCEQSLINAYGARKPRVDHAAVKEAILDLGLRSRQRPRAEQPPPEEETAQLPVDTGEEEKPTPHEAVLEQGKTYGVRLGSFQHAAEARAYANALTDRGHEARPVRAMLGDGNYVTHVMGGLFSERVRAQERADQFRNQGLPEAEVMEFSGWTSSGTLHTTRSSKDKYLKEPRSNDRPPVGFARSPLLPWPQELAEN